MAPTKRDGIRKSEKDLLIAESEQFRNRTANQDSHPVYKWRGGGYYANTGTDRDMEYAEKSKPNGELRYTVGIIGKRETPSGDVEYLAVWVAPDEQSWEPAQNFKPETVEHFEAQWAHAQALLAMRQLPHVEARPNVQVAEVQVAAAEQAEIAFKGELSVKQEATVKDEVE